VTVVLGVDPGAVDTGLVVIDDSIQDLRACMRGAFTVSRDDKVVDPLGNITVNRRYLHDVNASILDAVRRWDVTAIAYEGLKKPKGFKGGRVDFIDPASLAAIGMVIGGITARAWPVDLVTVPPGGNGSNLVWNLYPEPIRMASATAKGADKHRHERSAFDVALRMRQARALAARGRRYGP
jgi:hypothetical protein